MQVGLYVGKTIQPRRRKNRLQDRILSPAKTLFPNEVPGDTAFGKVTIALSSMAIDHIPI
jgi:hypothetical protein